MTVSSLPSELLLETPLSDLPFSGIATSSEEVCPGDLFLAFRGAKQDGNDYISSALSRGAVLAVSETRSGASILRCRSLISLLYELARVRLEEISPRVVAVTGSVGKSTFLSYASTLLGRRFRLHLPGGNYNTDVGVPLTVLEMPRTCQLLLLELGARQSGDIARLSLLARPHVAVMTRIGSSHLATFLDRKGVLRAKSEILLGLRPNGLLICNRDDPLLRSWSNGLTCRRLGVSLSDGTSDLALTESRDGFRLTWHGETLEGIRLVNNSEASRLSAALSAATALSLGLPMNELKELLTLCRPPSMRQEVIFHSGIHYIMDAYNASPESMLSALQLLSECEVTGRRCALLGDMLELGDDSEALHFSVGISAVKSGVTDLFCIGKLAEGIARGAAFAGLSDDRIHCFHCNEKEKLTELLSRDLRVGDALLLKASRALKLEEVLASLTE